MRAIIMAGGGGKRLRPLTCTMPKPMAPLLGRPIIDYCVALLKKHDITEITATLHYLPNQIRSYLGEGESLGVNMNYSLENMPMGTAGSVRHALGKKTERTLIISGDALTDIDLSGALRFHEANHAMATLVLTRVDTPSEYGVVLLDESGRVQRFFEKPRPAEVYSNLANTGIYILEPDALERIPENVVFDFSNDLFPLLLRENAPMFGFVSTQYWCDIGSIETYIGAQEELLSGKCALFTPPQTGITVEEGAFISPNAVLTSPCYICKGAEIASGARIGPHAVIGRAVRIGAYSSVKHSVILDGARLRENVELRGCVVCEGAQLEARSAVFDAGVVGARAHLEQDVQVKNGVRLWPERRIEAGSVCQNDVIWEQYAVQAPLDGFADTDITPDYALKLGAAFAHLCFGDFPVLLALADDGTQMGVMLKTALCAGVLSQGADVCDLGFVSRGAFSYAIRQFGCRGGLYTVSQEKQRAGILCCDAYGARLGSTDVRKLIQGIRDPLLPVTSRRLGLLSQADVWHGYDAYLRQSIGNAALSGTVVLSAPDGVFDTIARVMSGCGVRVLFSRAEREAELLSDQLCSGAAIAFLVKNDQVYACYSEERALDAHIRQSVLLLHVLERGVSKRFFVSADLPEEYTALLEAKGASVQRASRDADTRMRLCLQEDCYLPALFETEAEIVQISALAISGALERLVRTLPKIVERSGNASCSWKDLGRVMRGLVETEHLRGTELLEGVRVKDEKGWVLVHPEGTRACRVVAQSMRSEYAGELCALYLRKIRDIMEKE